MERVTSTEQPELSQEELQAYLEQLREADAADIVVQAYTMLGTGAEVKLGRPDARVLIDAMAGLAQATGARLGELGQRMQAGVAQLQMAQVEAERRAAAAPPVPGQPGAAQAEQTPQAPPAGPASAATGQPAEPSVTDRLWIPGRGPDPRRR
jgi:hypothetical protein